MFFRMLLSCIALTSIISCGLKDNSFSNTKSQGSVNRIRFMEDLRRIDGAYSDLVFNKGEREFYSATLVKIFRGEKTTRNLGIGFSCEKKMANENNSQTLVELKCKRDNRNVDGPLVEIAVTQNPSASSYTAIVTTTELRSNESKSETLASSLHFMIEN